MIGYINVNPPNPPTTSTINGTLSESSVTVNLAQPFVLQNADLVGLRMEFDVRKSLQTDGNGQVTGVVRPTTAPSSDDPDILVSSFTTNTIVSLTGTLDPVTHAIDASEVEVISNNSSYLGGLLTDVNPASPQPATLADFFVVRNGQQFRGFRMARLNL